MSEETPVIVDELSGEGSSEEETPKAPASVSEVEASPAESQVDDQSETDDDQDEAVASRPKVKISLKRGQELNGKVKTITDFGAFVDIDLPQDGLVHISELARHRVEKVSDVISVGEEVTVWVKSLEKERNRISLTMLKPHTLRYSEVNEGDTYEGEVTRIENYGIFVNIGLEREGLVHVSELSHDFVRTPSDVVSLNDTVQVKVIKVNRKKKQVNLSMKALMEAPASEAEGQYTETVEEDAFEESQEPLSTTMAAAFDRFATRSRSGRSTSKREAERRETRTNMKDVIERTLRTEKDE